MSTLSPDDIDKISTAVANKIRQESFHIDAEAHYNQHQELGQLLEAINNGRNAFFKGLASLVAVGVFVMAAIGINHGWGK